MSIDTAIGAVEMLGPEIECTAKYTADGVMTENGKIFFVPNSAGQVVSIDP